MTTPMFPVDYTIHFVIMQSENNLGCGESHYYKKSTNPKGSLRLFLARLRRCLNCIFANLCSNFTYLLTYCYFDN